MPIDVRRVRIASGRIGRAICLIAALICLPVDAAEQAQRSLAVGPTEISFARPLDRVQLQVTDSTTAGDLTRSLTYTSSDDSVAKVDETGLVSPVGQGTATITITGDDGATASIPVAVGDLAAAVDFTRDVIPVLSKAGCNQGACHASQYGKGEFKLSLFGFAPEQDWPQIVRDWQGRRISRAEPAASLVLRKPVLDVSHGGGQRFKRDSHLYRVLHEWIAAGTPKPPAESPELVGLQVSPQQRVYRPGDTQQLRVTAAYADGTERDVTRLALYDSLGESVATVDEDGLLTAVEPGQAAIMIRFQGQARVSMVMLPYDREVELADFQPHNFVDEEVLAHWQKLNVQPAGLCSDSEFIRRAFLDVIGTLPTPERVEAFLNSDAPDKRVQLVDELLGLTGDSARDIYGEEFAAYWTLKWGDLLRINRNEVGDGGMWAFTNWTRQSLRENKPVDQFVREIITAQGSIYANGPANFFKIATKPEDLAETTAQVFLGVRLQCAKCHHHPFEAYSQADYYGLAAFFTRVGNKGSLDFGALGRDSVVMVKNSGSIRHPRTRETMEPTPLLAEPVSLTEDARDLRVPLADWLTSPDNELFAKNIVNRFWGYLMGEGLVEPIDDLRQTNPASIPPLLDRLADDFVTSGYDLKHLLRTIMTSRVYQLDSTPRPENVALSRLYLHYNVKRLPAEVLLDAVDDVCGTQERFSGVPLGTRAIELPDSNYTSYFLDTLGRPQRVIVCECERTSEPNLAQVLHLLNGEVVNRKIADGNGRVAKLAKEDVSVDQAIERLYLATLSRTPTSEERAAAVQIVESAEEVKVGLEDVLWALLNGREFLFNH